jgi:hypothetical protein
MPGQAFGDRTDQNTTAQVLDGEKQMTHFTFCTGFASLSVPIGPKSTLQPSPMGSFSVAIQGTRLLQKVNTLLIYQGVWGIWAVISGIITSTAGASHTDGANPLY